MSQLRVKNWEKFQHYKDRNPPWIKLHYEMMTSEDWVMLSDASKLLAVVCMMIASRNDGHVRNDPAYIKRVAYLEKLPDLKPLIKSGFLMLADASIVEQTLEKCTTETEAYRTETEIYTEARAIEIADNFEAFWSGWIPFEMSKGSKSDASKAYFRATKGVDHETLIRTRDQYLANCVTHRCKTKHASSWLNSRGWERDDATGEIAATINGRHGPGSSAGKPSALDLALADRTHR